MVTGGVAPSKTLEPYLASHFNTAKDTHPPTTTGVPGIHEYAEYSLGRLMKITQFGVRAEIPTSLEIEASKYMLPFLVRVYFVSRLVRDVFRCVGCVLFCGALEWYGSVARRLIRLNAGP